LRRSSEAASRVYSRAEHVFILKYCFVSKSSVSVREAFNKEEPNKTALLMSPVSFHVYQLLWVGCILWMAHSAWSIYVGGTFLEMLVMHYLVLSAKSNNTEQFQIRLFLCLIK
jgi:hypothetical protein